MRYFRSFWSYENIRNAKCPPSTYPAEKNNPFYGKHAYVLVFILSNTFLEFSGRKRKYPREVSRWILYV